MNWENLFWIVACGVFIFGFGAIIVLGLNNILELEKQNDLSNDLACKDLFGNDATLAWSGANYCVANGVAHEVIWDGNKLVKVIK